MAGVEFTFTGAMRGSGARSLDLVLLFDTTTGEFGDREGNRVRQRVEALSRALDVTGSRYVLTAVLAGAPLIEGAEALSETCRVLYVDEIALDNESEPVDDRAAMQLDDRIRVLLPLTLPDTIEPSDGEPSLVQLIRMLPAGTEKELIDMLIQASIVGESAVTEAIAHIINSAFGKNLDEERS